MALFIPGAICPICEKPIGSASEIVMFPPFVANRLEPLFVFSDAVVHADCLAGHPLAAQAMKLREEAGRSSQPRNRVCATLGKGRGLCSVMQPRTLCVGRLLNPVFALSSALDSRAKATSRWLRPQPA
jgi:hypothetical protein